MTGSEEAGDYSQEPNKLMGSHDLSSVQRELGSHFKGTVHPPRSKIDTSIHLDCCGVS